MRAPESLTVPGAGGTPVQYWSLKPPHFDASKKYPVVFLIHGGPQGAWDDGWSSRWNPVALGRAGLGRRGAEPARLDRLRPEVRRRDLAGLGRQGDGRSRRRLRRRREAAVRRRRRGRGSPARATAATRSTGSSATRTASRPPSRTTASSTSSRWRWRPRSCGSPSGSSAARRGARRRARTSRSGRRTCFAQQHQDADARHHERARLPRAGRSGAAAVHRRCAATACRAEALVFPDEGHWVLKPLNSKRWHEAVFGWMKKYL